MPDIDPTRGISGMIEDYVKAYGNGIVQKDGEFFFLQDTFHPNHLYCHPWPDEADNLQHGTLMTPENVRPVKRPDRWYESSRGAIFGKTVRPGGWGRGLDTLGTRTYKAMRIVAGRAANLETVEGWSSSKDIWSAILHCKLLTEGEAYNKILKARSRNRGAAWSPHFIYYGRGSKVLVWYFNMGFVGRRTEHELVLLPYARHLRELAGVGCEVPVTVEEDHAA